jgi:hypothetical protein
MPFAYSPTALDALDTALTLPRLTRYLAFTNGDRMRAIQLYEHNTRISKAMFGIIQPLEIAFRNVANRALANGFARPDWYDTGILASPEIDSIDKARQSLWQWKKTETPDRVVAELMFGFWVRLLGKRYEQSLWVPHLHKCFSYGPKPDRQKMQDRFIKIKDLRNRVAHHEPIFFRKLERDYERVLTALEWICPVSACWVRSTHSIYRLNL